jgi:hypothetical protein
MKTSSTGAFDRPSSLLGGLCHRTGLTAVCCGLLAVGGAYAQKVQSPRPSFETLSESLDFTAPATVTGTASTAALMFIPMPVNGVHGFLNAENQNGTLGGSLSISTFGLANGTYTVSTTLTSDGSAVVLGTFTVPTKFPWWPPIVGGPQPLQGVSMASAISFPPVHIPVDPPIHIPIDPIPGNFGFVIFGPFGTPLPAGYNLFDVATVSILDSSSKVVYTASTSPIQNGSYIAGAPVTPGPDAPTAKGYGEANASATNGKDKGMIFVHAWNVPASTTYTYAINGADIGTVTTTSTGHLRLFSNTGKKVNPLPSTVNLFGITSITVHDSGGKLLLSADF